MECGRAHCLTGRYGHKRAARRPTGATKGEPPPVAVLGTGKAGSRPGWHICGGRQVTSGLPRAVKKKSRCVGVINKVLHNIVLGIGILAPPLVAGAHLLVEKVPCADGVKPPLKSVGSRYKQKQCVPPDDIMN